MFQKYYEFIQRSISNLGNKNADISIESYVKVVFSSLWLIISYLLVAFGVTGILSAPYFMYTLIIRKRVHSKNKEVNEEIAELIKERNLYKAEFHEKYKDEEANFSEYNNKIRDEFHEKRNSIERRIDKLADKKDLSVIWKTYLMVAPLLLIYLAFVIPLILIVIDLMFKTANVPVTIMVMTGYFVLLGSAIFLSYEKLYFGERKVY